MTLELIVYLVIGFGMPSAIVGFLVYQARKAERDIAKHGHGF